MKSGKRYMEIILIVFLKTFLFGANDGPVWPEIARCCNSGSTQRIFFFFEVLLHEGGQEAHEN